MKVSTTPKILVLSVDSRVSDIIDVDQELLIIPYSEGAKTLHLNLVEDLLMTVKMVEHIVHHTLLRLMSL